MESKAKKGMGLLLVLLSALFLWDPNVGFIDPLPDLIGYVLLYVGLYRLSDMNARVEEARRRIGVLLWVGAGQLIATWILYGWMAERAAEMNPYEQPVGVLLCSFALLFFKWYFLIPAYRELFGGMDRLAEQHGARTLADEVNGKTQAQRMVTRTTVYMIVSSLMATLPELAILTSFENDIQNPWFPWDWYRYVGLFRVFCGVIAFVFGLIWLILFLRYFAGALADRAWGMRLHERYEADVLTQTGMLKVRLFKVFFLCLQIAIVFAFHLRLSGYEILPGIGLSVFAGLAVTLLAGRIGVRRVGALVSAVLLGVVSLAQCYFNHRYLQYYTLESALYQPGAYSAYITVRVLGVAEAFFTVLLVIWLIKLLLELVFAHTSVEYAGDVTHALSNDATARLHRAFEKRALWSLIFFILAGIGNALDAFFHLQYPWIWLISFALSATAIWIFYAMLHELLIQIKYRYQGEDTNKRA